MVEYDEVNTIGKIDGVPVFKTIPIALEIGRASCRERV